MQTPCPRCQNWHKHGKRHDELQQLSPILCACFILVPIAEMKWAVLAGVILSGAGGLTDIPVVAPFSDAAMNVQSFMVMTWSPVLA